MSRRSSPLARRQPGLSPSLQRMLEDALGHHRAGRLAEAEQLYRQILAADARHADSLHLLGMIAFRTGHYEQAVQLIRQAIAIDGNQAAYHSNLGNVFREEGKLDEASACYEEALVVKPDSIEALNGLGIALATQGKIKQAAVCFERALVLRPDYAEAHTNLGNTLKAEGKLDAAAACYERALAIKPDDALACNNLGTIRELQGMCDDAIALFERALAQKPDYPDAQLNRAFTHLLYGDFASGLPGYEARRKSANKRPRHLPQPEWRGEKLNGARILLHAEQGLGDTLQSLRYLPIVQAAGGSVVLEVQGPLRRIAAGLPGVTSLVASGEPLPAFDWHCPLMSLPLACGTTMATIPAQVPYLSAPQAAQKKADACPWPASGLRVGIAWAGNPTLVKDRYRSLPLALLEPLLQLQGVHFFSLQKGPAAEELATAPGPITDLGQAIEDMADTAALMAHLDLVIAVDTSVVHLAGALGKPVWVMLTIAPDWRWLLDREDSPWYPSMRLFRQTKLEDWPTVVSMVRIALIEECARRGRDNRHELSETLETPHA